MKCMVDGFEFTLGKGSNTIYVFKGDAFVTGHICLNAKEAEKMFKEIKTKKKVVFPEKGGYAWKNLKNYTLK